MSKYFTEIFKKLVPQGHAVLVMKRADQPEVITVLQIHQINCNSIITTPKKQFISVALNFDFFSAILSLNHDKPIFNDGQKLENAWNTMCEYN